MFAYEESNLNPLGHLMFAVLVRVLVHSKFSLQKVLTRCLLPSPFSLDSLREYGRMEERRMRTEAVVCAILTVLFATGK